VTLGKILIVDDNRDLALALEIRLHANGYSTLLAEDGPAAMRLALREKPYAITLDLSLPGESGLIVLEKLRRTPEISSIPVIIVTGDCSALTKSRVLDAGAMAILSKPVSHQQLLAKLGEIAVSQNRDPASTVKSKPLRD
jgi:two-component system KDP operon response regulator KdpE